MELSRRQEIGELDQNSIDLEVITWKIPNVSSIFLAVDYSVQSPPFYFLGASWILKIYFYGQKKFNTKGFIDLAIERLHSEIEVHDFSFKICFKNVFDTEFKPINKIFSFSTNHTTMNIIKIMENFLERFNKWEIAPNDTLTLVCEIRNKKSVIETQSKGQSSGKSENTVKPEVGEIHSCSYQIETIKWVIPNASSLPSPADYQVQSPKFSFAGASWALKIYPYFKLDYRYNQSIYVALTRLDSQISEHYVSVNISFEDYIKNTIVNVSRSHIFNSDNTQGHAICFTLQEEQITAPFDTFSLFCEFRTKKFSESLIGDSFKSGCILDLHKNRVLDDLRELFLKQEDCDIIIKVQGQEFPAHRAILKARSPVFNSAFRNNMKERETGIIDIEDCNPDTFSDFLCFLYSGDVQNLTAANMFDLFTTADKYESLDLRSRCLQFIKDNLSVDTFCDTITLALQYSETELIQFSTDFFTKNLTKIIVTVQWQSFITENPIRGNELMIKALLPNNRRM